MCGGRASHDAKGVGEGSVEGREEGSVRFDGDAGDDLGVGHRNHLIR